MAGSTRTRRTAPSSRTEPGAVAFPPCDAERENVLDYLHQSPGLFGVASNRWTLPVMRRHLPAFLSLSSDSSVSRRLSRWKIKTKAGRLHIQSPDPLYQEKLAAVLSCLSNARSQPETVRLLYADEFTYYRQPALGRRWHTRGKAQPTVPWKGSARTKRRVVATLDAVTGRVVHSQGSTIGKDALCRFMRTVRDAYPPTQRVVIAWDNWPVHKLPDVQKAATDQGVELLYIPTYAPWTNPIEKLWKWLKDEVIRFHRCASPRIWHTLWTDVEDFLNRFHQTSTPLLKYVGLALPD